MHKVRVSATYFANLNCFSILANLDCLPAFTHEPASLVKCYCTSKCPDVETLRQTCASGQLQTDPCGVCLECAPGVSDNNDNDNEYQVIIMIMIMSITDLVLSKWSQWSQCLIFNI